ncbi:hypothetical protein PTSG_01822 [Salpingoeca rosetta]|uniref:HOOK N-terminal domain-containing protein n=1 Tax=Salpingoeca rosetta (strain ATCC 50818 / BSB-021) TaxID=946362 RepID=F2TZ22_SALR5|nr:uncharacterized protein PTSG_01822 [Salpingoeca rosetta]EGD78846.1 hypothetical protein PTSG_01822 [Salpingoeca rosetta]|eukprot:XP_004997802.1 hypothetical protein PTSG_01822 [Salpingoeca rosetta]
MSLSLQRDVVSDDDIDTFMASPLVAWLKGLAKDTSTGLNSFSDLVDGIFLNEVACVLDEDFFGDYIGGVEENVDGDTDKQNTNLNLLLESLTNYYQDHLHSVLVLELPIPATITRKPLLAAGLESIRRFIVLLLGVSVKCSAKERHVEYMQSFDSATQVTLMAAIQEVLTGVVDVSFDLEDAPREHLASALTTALQRLNEAVADRDKQSQHLDNTLAMMEAKQPSSRGSSRHRTSDTSVGSVRDLEYRMQLLRDELEDKDRMQRDVTDANRKLRSENNELTSKVRELYVLVEDTQMLKDELDEWRQKGIDTEKTQRELTKCKEKLEDQEYLLRRIEDLQEQLNLSIERNERLRGALHNAEETQRISASRESENRMLEAQIKELTHTQDRHLKRIREITSQSVRLEEENKHLKSKVARLETTASSKPEEGGVAVSSSSSPSPSDATESNRVRKLEDENEKLTAQLKRLHTSTSTEEADTDALKEERERQQREISKLTAELTSSEQQNEELRLRVKEQTEQLAKAQETVTSLQEQVASLKSNAASASPLSIEKKLGDVFERGVRLKDGRIKTLEARLKEATEHNEQLKQDMALAKRHIELLRSAASRRDSSPLATRRAPSSSKLSSATGSPLVSQTDRATKSSSQFAFDGASEQSSPVSAVSLLQAELSALKSENSMLKQSLEAARATSSDTNEVVGLREKLDNISNMNEMLVSECDKLRRQARTLEREAHKHRAAELKQQDKVKLLTKIKASLEAENASYVEKLNSLLKQNQDLLVKSLQSTTQLKDKEEELRQQVHNWTKEREALTDELEQARSKKKLFRFFKKKGKSGGSTTPDPAPSTRSPDLHNGGDESGSSTANASPVMIAKRSSIADSGDISTSDPELYKHSMEDVAGAAKTRARADTMHRSDAGRAHHQTHSRDSSDVQTVNEFLQEQAQLQQQEELHAQDVQEVFQQPQPQESQPQPQQQPQGELPAMSNGHHQQHMATSGSALNQSIGSNSSFRTRARTALDVFIGADRPSTAPEVGMDDVTHTSVMTPSSSALSASFSGAPALDATFPMGKGRSRAYTGAKPTDGDGRRQRHRSGERTRKSPSHRSRDRGDRRRHTHASRSSDAGRGDGGEADEHTPSRSRRKKTPSSSRGSGVSAGGGGGSGASKLSSSASGAALEGEVPFSRTWRSSISGASRRGVQIKHKRGLHMSTSAADELRASSSPRGLYTRSLSSTAASVLDPSSTQRNRNDESGRRQSIGPSSLLRSSNSSHSTLMPSDKGDRRRSSSSHPHGPSRSRSKTRDAGNWFEFGKV